MYCENCGQQLESYMSYCPKCGTAINQKNLPNNNFYGGASINTKYENTVVFCNKCGKPLDYSYPNCLVCGVPNPVYKNKHNF